ncbi:rhomboid family intramembrane serine protease [Spirillospora sp. NPDC047279]|uniref:rhomboid family intramembrane serine protease n=1 Tax=Spirillospora sp. NPDC047279 TaxID=3155478 RepID=UPI0033EDE645
MSTDPTPSSGSDTPVPTCYRHPGRETYVRCTRCDRYICPECMRDAAVGHQCVECVAEGNKSVRQTRTRLGARDRRDATPVVTYSLVGLCVLVYLAEIVWPARMISEFAMWGGVGRFDVLVPDAGVAGGEWYRLVTGTFLHEPLSAGGFALTHILFNMWALWLLGPPLERELGRVRFLALYMAGGLGGSVLTYLVAPDQVGVGASGAIFGLFAAFFVIGRKLGGEVGPILFILVLNLVITFSWTSKISWQAHIGGLVAGALLAVAYAYAPEARRKIVNVAAPVIILVVFAALVVVKTSQLTSGTV